MTHSKLSPSDLHGHVLRCPGPTSTYIEEAPKRTAEDIVAYVLSHRRVDITNANTIASEVVEELRTAGYSVVDKAGVDSDLFEALIAARAELEAYEADATGEHYNNPSLNAAIAKAVGEGK